MKTVLKKRPIVVVPTTTFINRRLHNGNNSNPERLNTKRSSTAASNGARNRKTFRGTRRTVKNVASFDYRSFKKRFVCMMSVHREMANVRENNFYFNNDEYVWNETNGFAAHIYRTIFLFLFKFMK